MPKTFIYRKSSGEVTSATTDPFDPAKIDAKYFAFVVDPLTPNGDNLAVPKFSNGIIVRNATPQEITAFAVAITVDVTLQQRDRAKLVAFEDPVFSKALKATASVLLLHINELRALAVPPLPALVYKDVYAEILQWIDEGYMEGEKP